MSGATDAFDDTAPTGPDDVGDLDITIRNIKTVLIDHEERLDAAEPTIVGLSASVDVIGTALQDLQASIETATGCRKIGDYVEVWGIHTHSVTQQVDTIDFSALAELTTPTEAVISLTCVYRHPGPGSIGAYDFPTVTAAADNFTIDFGSSFAGSYANKYHWRIIGVGNLV